MNNTRQPLGEAEKKDEEKASPSNKPKQLNVYRSWCKRCGICVAFCPKKALERDPEGVPRWTAEGKCIGCRMCELRCPDFAIQVVVERDEEEPHGK